MNASHMSFMMAQIMYSFMNYQKDNKSILQGFIVDGFPMDAEQADAFVKDIGEPNMVLLLECNDEILKQRLNKR